MILIQIMSTSPTPTPAPTSDDKESRAKVSALSELLFVILPFIVIGITLAHRGEFRTFLFIPEWSIVSAVIVGQAIARIASFAIGRPSVRKENTILALSMLLVCLLVPILIVLAIALTSVQISIKMATIQAIFFALSALAFWGASYLEISARPDDEGPTK